MTLSEALALNGTYIRLLLDHGDSDGAWVHSGRVVGVCVPFPGSPVEPHLLVDCGDPISPCGGGSEVFLSSISRLLYSGDKPSEPTRPALRWLPVRERFLLICEARAKSKTATNRYCTILLVVSKV